MERIAPASAASMSASSNTTFADLPPSSKLTGVRLSAAARMIARPVALSPVNVMRCTRGSRVSASPTSSGPNPCTTFSTPGGRPASSASSPSREAVIGLCSAGLSTTVFPNASAGATFQLASISGKFHGLMATATPAGG